MRSIIAEFIADLQLAGRQPLTIESHKEELERLCRWCEVQGYQWDQLDRRKMQYYARTKADLAASTRANYFTTWRVFFRWCVEQGYISSSPAAGFRTPTKPRPVPKALNLAQLRQLITYLNDQAAVGRRQQRDRVLLLTGIYAGLRCAELAMLRWPMVDLDAGIITIRLSKMNHGRSVPVHPDLGSLLKNWRVDQAGSDDWPVFSLDGQPLATARPGKIARRISAESGVPFTTHVLRHTFATWVLRKSRDLYSVSKALGHSQLQQTEIYLSGDVESTRAAVEALPGLIAW